MATSKTYTERIAVRIPAQQRDEIEAQLGDVGLTAAMRDATLRAIGREDLVIDEQRDEGGHKRAKRSPSQAAWTVTPVPLTPLQRRAIDAAARAKEEAASKLMLDSLRFELGLSASATERGWRKGWPVGRRKSDAPTYTPAQKARLVAYAEKHGVAATSEKHSISRATIYTWKRAKKKADKKKR